jgi:hypothetical protein
MESILAAGQVNGHHQIRVIRAPLTVRTLA